VLELIRSNKGMAQHLFKYNSNEKIESEQLVKIIKPNFSPIGHHRRRDNLIVAGFIRLILACSDKSSSKCEFVLIKTVYQHSAAQLTRKGKALY
jgi:hypothetical protein